MLFVDGKLAASDEDSCVLLEGTLVGRYVRFGKPSSDLRDRGMIPFTGWVDELAIWNRPLSHVEVKQQFQSAIGVHTKKPGWRLFQLGFQKVVGPL